MAIPVGPAGYHWVVRPGVDRAALLHGVLDTGAPDEAGSENDNDNDNDAEDGM